jgi:hydroxymethylpyrimidine pyrophosphatase-like HAD family hydrolase
MGDLNVVSGGAHNLEITNRTAAKGLGILTLARLLDVDPGRTMACGDDGNDLDMIRRAAFGVAMANAAAEVRQQADYVTDSNERNGAGKAIEYFMELMDR